MQYDGRQTAQWYYRYFIAIGVRPWSGLGGGGQRLELKNQELTPPPPPPPSSSLLPILLLFLPLRLLLLRSEAV